jgi:hypothetical protein
LGLESVEVNSLKGWSLQLDCCSEIRDFLPLKGVCLSVGKHVSELYMIVEASWGKTEGNEPTNERGEFKFKLTNRIDFG